MKLSVRLKTVVFMIGVIVVVSFVYTYLSIRTEQGIIRTEIVKRAEAITSVAAKNAELPILSGSPRLLKNMVSFLNARSDIVAVTFLDTHLKVLMHEGDPIVGPLPSLNPGGAVTIVEDSDSLIFYSPIFSEHEKEDIDLVHDSASAKTIKEHIGWLRLVFSTSAMREAEAAIVRRSLILQVVFAAVTSVSLFFLISIAARPITQVLQVADGIADGDFSHDLPLQRKDEIGAMAEAFQRMKWTIQMVLHETERLILSIQQGRLESRGNAELFKGEWRKMIRGINLLTEEFSKTNTELQEAKGSLERRVQERTAELARVNAELLKEVQERKQAEESMLKARRNARTIVMLGVAAAPENWVAGGGPARIEGFCWNWRIQDPAAAPEILPLDVPPGFGYIDCWKAAIDQDDFAAMTALAARAFATGTTRWEHEFRCVDRDGRLHWFTQSASVEIIVAGRWNVTAINTDVTERVLAEKALRSSEERLSTVFRLSPTAICIVRAADNTFVDANDAFVEGSGYARSEIIGHTPPELHLWDKSMEHVAILKELRRKGSAIAFKLRAQKKSGERVVGLCSAARIDLNGDAHFLWLIQNISDLELAEEALRESEHRFRQVTENIDEVFWLMDLATNQMIYVSPAYLHIWGRMIDSIYAAPQSWLDSVYAEDSARVREALLKQAEGYDIEFRITRPDGALRWIHARAFPVKDTNGATYRIAAVASDVTLRKEFEEKFRQSQKMEAVGQLASGIAHDFNNLLTVIQMQSSFLLADTRAYPGAREGIEQIMEAAKRAANLTRQLLTFSRRQIQAARNLDLAEVLGSMTKMLRRILSEDISLESHFARDLPQVYADPGMMEQVLMNLAVNARDAMPSGGRLIISLDVADLDASYVGAHPAARVGRFVRLSVSDTGCGIQPEIRTRIFEPFFTTKDVGQGTGLGLATVLGIVQQHHGWIEVETEVGKGSMFRVFLPALPEIAPKEAGKLAKVVAKGGSETILLVEDESALRSIAVAALRQRGYNVIEAGNATEALDRWDEARGNVDLLVTDFIMPGGVSGRDLAEKLLHRRPTLRVIYTTGHGIAAFVAQLRLEPNLNYLEKPYSFEDLTTIIRRRLDES